MVFPPLTMPRSRHSHVGSAVSFAAARLVNISMPFNTKNKPFKLKPYDKPLIEASITNINTWTKGYFNLQLFPWQQYFFHYPVKDKMGIAGIRTGKSFLVAVAALQFCQTHPNARYLNACISTEQAKIVYHTCLELIDSPLFAHWVDHVERSPYAMIRLINGSELWFRSVGYEAELIRGYEFDFISLDECAYITNPLTVQTLWGRTLGINRVTNRPREGWFWQISSPKGKGSWVFERWRKGDTLYPEADPQKYLSYRARTTENLLLDRNQIMEIMHNYSERMIEQELEGQFMDSDTTEFNFDSIMNACSEQEHPEVKLLTDQIRTWQEQRQRFSKKQQLLHIEKSLVDIEFYELDPIPGHRYIAAWDLGKKANEAGRNATVGMVFDITETPWKLIGLRYLTNLPYITSATYIEEWDRKYNDVSFCHTCIDATGKGDVVNELLVIERGLKIDPIEFTSSNKPDMITAGRLALERNLVRFPFIRRFVDQLSVYERFDKDLAQDMVMAYCMAMYRAHEMVGLRLHTKATRDSLILTNQTRLNYRRQSAGTADYHRFLRRRRAAH